MSGSRRAPSEATAPRTLTTPPNNSNDLPHDDPVRNGLVRDGLAGERVSGIQRARILSAMTEVVSEQGAANFTIGHVVARSGMSRRTFYELFEDREDCFLAAFNEGVRRITALVGTAYEQSGSWRKGMRAALTALLEFLEDEPDMGRLLIVESLAAGPAVLDHRSRVLTQIIAAIDQGHTEARTGRESPLLTAEGIAGGVLSVLHSRLLARPDTVTGSPLMEREQGPLVRLTGPLMSMIVLPYLGQTVARKEIERPVPQRTIRARAGYRDPFRALGMRCTYRTVRMLLAVADRPGSSNRALADSAGIADQGQVSKLLARLQGLGLIQNSGPGLTSGEPNAWTLTELGREVEGVIAHQTTSS